jgi:hypothetical protein
VHSTTRFLAVPAGGLLLAAAVAAPALAHAGGDAPPQASRTETHEQMMSGDHPGMARMHEQIMSDHPGMARMHEQIMSDHPGMARMHEQMMSGHTDAAEPTPTPTR